MKDSCQAILSFIKGKTRKHLDTDRLLISGIIRELEILGEAAGSVTAETKKKFPKIPWKRLNGMRNRLIHAYFDINNDIVWQTIQEAVPPLSKDLTKMIATLEKT